MAYNNQVILSSNRLLFRQHIIADMNAYCAMEMDASIRRYVGGSPRTREEAERRFIPSLDPVTDRLSMWATVLKQTGQYIGRCGVYPHFNHQGVPIADEGTLAFYIASAYWRQGFATEASRAFIRFGFDELHLKRIVATVQAGNDASSHILKKLGFEWVSTEEGHRTFYHLELKNPVT
jgi:RimJ/RimL family protein N-acetyltransferase